ncbi:hypothetical protein D3C75_524110 [compost metagenome]
MGVAIGDLLAVQLDDTVAVISDAEQGLDYVGALGPHQTGDAEDLSLVQVEAHVLDGGLVLGRQVLDFEDHLFRLVGFLREALGQLATDHHADDLIHGHALERLGRHPLAIPQYGDLVTELEDLFHLVGDVDDAAPLVLQLVDDLEEVVDLFLGQGGGGFVHDDDLGVIGECLGDLDHLHLGDGEGADLDPWVYVDVQFVEDALGVVIHLAVVDEPALGGVATEPHVVHHGALQYQVQLLVHHGYAIFQRLFGRGEVDLLALEEDLALILLVDAEQALEQRGLPCAILAHQRMHRMRTDP